MNTLLEYSYKKCPQLNYYNKDTEGLYRDVYDKVVNLARDKIRVALRKHMGQLILKTIYLLKTTNISETVISIIGSFSTYKGSLWRLAMLHATASYVISKTHEQRISDIMDTCDSYLPYSNHVKREEVMTKLSVLTPDSDIFSYINVYCTFGHFLLP